MSYPVRTQTIALDEHELRSLRRWLNQMVTVNGRDIFLQRAPSDFSRPAYVLKEIDRQPIYRGRSMTVDQVDWQIEVLGEDFWTVKQEVAEIRQRFLQSSRVPLYLWGWQYPDVFVEELVGVGTLPAGEVSVGISAVNYEGEESLISDTVQITVALNSAVRVSWTPWPRSVPVAKEYRVYAGANGVETLEATVADPAKNLNVFHDLTSLAGGGASPQSSSVLFSQRYLRVITNEISVRTAEHPAADGIFNGYINFRTLTESQRIARPSVTPEQEIATVTKTVEVV